MTYDSLLKDLKKLPKRSLNDHTLLIDGHNLFLRNFCQVKAMTKDGVHVGGLTGFLQSLGYLVRLIDPTRVIVVFDGKGSTIHRKRINKNYKANRKTTQVTNWGIYDSKQEELTAISNQIDRLKHYLSALPVHYLSVEKYEADDIISYLAQTYSRSGKRVTIVTSDRDLLQNVDKNVEVFLPIKKKTVTKENIVEEIGVSAKNYPIVKAITGDKSDNLDGIKGVGTKSLIKEFPELKEDSLVLLSEVYEKVKKQVDSKKLFFARIISDWDLVETNYSIMNLTNTEIGNYEKEIIVETLKAPIPELKLGAIMYLLNQDKIESITHHTDRWVQNFRNLITVS